MHSVQQFEPFLACPRCDQSLVLKAQAYLCEPCHDTYEIKEGRLYVSQVPDNIIPTLRDHPDDPANWGDWRRSNFEFLKRSLLKWATPESVILDIGAGQSQFRDVLNQYRRLACDIYPYDQVNIVCDATQFLPIKNNSVDVVHLSNVLEHIDSPHNFLQVLVSKLKPGGRVIAMVPFMVGEHQAPYDFHRYTRYAIHSLCKKSGLTVDHIESWGDSLQLNTQFGWLAEQNLKKVDQGVLLKLLIFVYRRLLSISTRVNKLIRHFSDISLINSSLADGCPHGYMFVARK